MSETTEPVRFYRASDKPYGILSNLARTSFEFDGQVWGNAEAAYQYGKPREAAVRNWLMAAPSPALLAMAAHGLYSWDISPGWSKNRYDRMHRVVLAKFRGNACAWEVLRSTGDREIIESAKVDNAVNRRWGQVNGKGTNWLGKILMDVRREVRENPPF